MKDTKQDRIFYTIVNVVLTILLIIVLFPLLYILACSFSSAKAVQSGKVFLWPVYPSLDGYMAVFMNENIWIGYRNTILYTVLGTIVNVIMTMVCAYPLARRNLPLKGPIMFLFTFTMFFSGGMIPNYLLVRNLGLLNNPLALIIPSMMSVYNIIIARTNIQTSIPHEILEAAQIDGCSDHRFFISFVLPLSKACMAVLTLYYAVGHWNSYFNAFLYLSDRKLYPLALFLREILVSNRVVDGLHPDLLEKKEELAEVLKYALIVVSTIPVLCIYPFIQKYFVKSVLIGSIKG